MKIAWLKRAHSSPRVTLIPIIIRHTPNAVKGNGFSRWFPTFPIEARGLSLFLLFFSPYSVTLTLGLRIKLAGTKDGSRRRTDQQKEVIPDVYWSHERRRTSRECHEGDDSLLPPFVPSSLLLLSYSLLSSLVNRRRQVGRQSTNQDIEISHGRSIFFVHVLWLLKTTYLFCPILNYYSPISRSRVSTKDPWPALCSPLWLKVVRKL